MKIKTFLEALKKCKTTSYVTRLPDYIKVVSSVNDGVRLYQLKSEKVCDCCDRKEDSRYLMIYLNKDIKLTIFQANMLWLIFMEQKRPTDYAHYHSCEAGKEFIEIIKTIVVL